MSVLRDKYQHKIPIFTRSPGRPWLLLDIAQDINGEESLEQNNEDGPKCRGKSAIVADILAKCLHNIYRWGFHGSKNIADAPGYTPQFISTTHLKK